MSVTAVTFPSGDLQLAGTLYLPEDTSSPVPAVAMGPGLGGVKEMVMPPYAAALNAVGIAALAIDPPNFGASEGEPRQHIDTDLQQLALRHGLDYLETRPEVDASRLAVWGSSLSSGHALGVTAIDSRVRSTVLLIPFTGLGPASNLYALVPEADEAAKRLAAGEAPKMITTTGEPGEYAVMSSDGAAKWTADVTVSAPSYRNEVTLASISNINNYHPVADSSVISTPVHAVIATKDAITPAAAAHEVLDPIPNVEIVEFPETHFEIFDDHLQETIDLTVRWFSADLLP